MGRSHFAGSSSSRSPHLPLRLSDALAGAELAGFIGSIGVEGALRHSAAMADVVGGAPALVVDLGSGGGVPGLVLATCWPESRLWLVERAARRAAFLREAVHELGLEGRVEVVEESAEEVAHQPGRREQATVTVARGFASIGVTLECAAGLTAPGGRIVVAAPPQGWDLGPGVATWSRLGELGLGAPSEREADGYHFLVVAKVRPADLRYPRRWPAMRRAPLVGPREGSGGPIG